MPRVYPGTDAAGVNVGATRPTPQHKARAHEDFHHNSVCRTAEPKEDDDRPQKQIHF